MCTYYTCNAYEHATVSYETIEINLQLKGVFHSKPKPQGYNAVTFQRASFIHY